jgi:hypothetical protein
MKFEKAQKARKVHYLSNKLPKPSPFSTTRHTTEKIGWFSKDETRKNN